MDTSAPQTHRAALLGAVNREIQTEEQVGDGQQ